MKYKRKRKVKWRVVLFVIFILMIIVGGIFMYINSFSKDNENTDTKNDKEIVSDTSVGEVFGSVTDMASSLEKAPSNYLEFQLLEDGEYVTEKGYTLKIQNKVASIDGIVIVNKTYTVPSSYQPIDPEQKIQGERCEQCLEKEVMSSFRLMASDAKVLGLNIYIASGYRSYSYQERLYNNYTAVSGIDGADTYSARPGHSEHQTGLCFDLNSVDDSFANTDEGRWVNENASNYGFIIRYPKGKEHITGYQYESWHLRYVGKTLAKELYQDGTWITLEEYYGISSSYGS